MKTCSFLQIGCLAGVVVALLAGCHPRDGRPTPRQRELARTDFEGFRGWAPAMLPQLATDKAHSGKFSLRVDPQHPYSPTFRAGLGQLFSHRPRRITLGAWVWVPGFRDDAVLVMAITNPENPDNPVFRKEVYLNDSSPFGAWKWVSRDLDIPLNTNFSSRSLLVVYLFAKDVTSPVYADDLLLTELW